ncbi:MAG TPA: hypothetical protein VFQ85_16305 [Mycobacteriales bacterium]|nr:hypothetical protein [Mycobacteriales bacterium]
MRGITGRISVVLLLVAAATVSGAGPAQALACDAEQVKMVQTGRNTYGSMGTLYAYNRTIAWCGTSGNSVFWALGGGFMDMVEIGTRQSGTMPGVFAIFVEYSIYPAPLVYHDSDELSGTTYANGQWVSFNATNLTGTSYELKTQYALGSSQTGWTTFYTTPYAAANYGLPMSEVARYGNTDASIHAIGLKYRPVTGGWLGWDSLTCAEPRLNTIPDWDATKYSNTEWATTYAPPRAGDC